MTGLKLCNVLVKLCLSDLVGFDDDGARWVGVTPGVRPCFRNVDAVLTVQRGRVSEMDRSEIV